MDYLEGLKEMFDQGLFTKEDYLALSSVELDADEASFEVPVGKERQTPLEECEPEDFELVKGIGVKIEEALYAEGYVCWKEINLATDAELLNIPGIGMGVLNKLRKAASIR